MSLPLVINQRVYLEGFDVSPVYRPVEVVLLTPPTAYEPTLSLGPGGYTTVFDVDVGDADGKGGTPAQQLACYMTA